MELWTPVHNRVHRHARHRADSVVLFGDFGLVLPLVGKVNLLVVAWRLATCRAGGHCWSRRRARVWVQAVGEGGVAAAGAFGADGAAQGAAGAGEHAQFLGRATLV